MANSSLRFSLSFIVLCSILAISSSFTILRTQAFVGRVGGWKKVPDVKNNKEIQDLGRYSVDEYNKNTRKYQKKVNETSGPVKFLAVEDAEEQVVSGVKYRLTISATSASGEPKTFDAVVVVKAWEKSQPRQLLTFSPSPPRQ